MATNCLSEDEANVGNIIHWKEAVGTVNFPFTNNEIPFCDVMPVAYAAPRSIPLHGVITPIEDECVDCNAENHGNFITWWPTRGTVTYPFTNDKTPYCNNIAVIPYARLIAGPLDTDITIVGLANEDSLIT